MTEVNTSGLNPQEYNVLVYPAEVEAKTKGGLILSEETLEKEQFGRMEGTLVAVSPMAFSFAEERFRDDMPKVGDHVLFSKYQATEINGRDGRKYWIMKDQSIAGVFTDE